MTRLLALILAALAFGLAPVLALAQITPGTACGAAGTGYVVGHHGGPVLQPRTAVQAAGTRVAANGYWQLCDKTELSKPAPPKACHLPATVTWRDGDRVCRGAGIAIAHGRLGSVVSGPHRGVYVAQCSDGQVTEVLSICDERRDCEGAADLSDDGQRTVWHWSGRLQDGQRGTATASDGRARPVQCVAGVVGLR